MISLRVRHFIMGGEGACYNSHNTVFSRTSHLNGVGWGRSIPFCGKYFSNENNISHQSHNRYYRNPPFWNQKHIKWPEHLQKHSSLISATFLPHITKNYYSNFPPMLPDLDIYPCLKIIKTISPLLCRIRLSQVQGIQLQ